MNQLNIRTSPSTIRTPQLADAVSIAMLFLSSRANALGMFPFGLAFFAAVSDKSIAYLGVIAACFGIASRSGFLELPQYVTAFVLYWIFTYLYKRDDEIVCSAACGLSMLIGGLFKLLAGYGGLYRIFLLVTESLISAIVYGVFRKTRIFDSDYRKRGRMSPEEYICSALSIGIFIAGLGGIGIGGVSLTNVFAVYAVVLTALNTGITAAGCTGLCIGFMSALSSSAAVVMMGIYAVGAIFANFMSSFKRLGCALGFIGGTAVILIYAKNIYDIPLTLLEAAIGAALFLITPNSVHDYFKSFFDKPVRVETVSAETRMREYAVMRLRKSGEAFNELHNSFVAVSEGRLRKYSDDMSVLSDEIAARICDGCRLCGKCWQTEFRRTYKNLLALISAIEKHGTVNMENAPSDFCERCIHSEIFIYELNHVYELFRYSLLRRADAVNARDLLSVEFCETDKLFCSIAADIEDGFYFLEEEEEKIVDKLDTVGIIPYEISVIESNSGRYEVYLRLPPSAKHTAVEGVISDVLGVRVYHSGTSDGMSKYLSRPGFVCDASVMQLTCDGERVNGDCASYFVTGDSRFYAILADGMGSGENAQYESASVMRLLSSFLKAGFGISTALGILNSSMCLKLKNEKYSTLDLLAIDLYTGEAELYKAGGAETLVLSGDKIEEIKSTEPPVGLLPNIGTECRRFKLESGDVMVLMTDGVTECGISSNKTSWISDLMIMPHRSMEELSTAILKGAVEKNKGAVRDDMSVIAIRIMQ